MTQPQEALEIIYYKCVDVYDDVILKADYESYYNYVKQHKYKVYMNQYEFDLLKELMNKEKNKNLKLQRWENE